MTSPPIPRERRLSPGLMEIIDRCSNLTALALFDSYSPDYILLLHSLVQGFAFRLTSLELDSPSLPEFRIPPCDHFLPHFPNLTHVSLGRNNVSKRLPHYINQLVCLVSLRLGPGVHLVLAIDSLLSLVEGSSKHPCLERLILDCFDGRIGRRIDENDSGGEEVYAGMVKDGWRRPIFRQGFDQEDVAIIRTVCKRNGVTIEGGVVNVFRVFDAYHLEEANRVVLRCFHNKQALDVGLWYDNPRLSDDQLTELDFDYLELVKIELPEENWFALTLE
ncbi:hypothetical protein JCM5353_007722 [Sporobolomyces roseus]